jgi:hypothetical protein
VPAVQARHHRVAATLIERAAAHPEVLATSAAKGTGLDRLRAELAALAA